MLIGISLAVLTGLTWAIISMMMSFVAKYKVSVFKFYLIGNAVAMPVAWLLFPSWDKVAPSVMPYLLPFALILILSGLVNVASQAIMVLTMKLGHNGISIAIRNCAGAIPFLTGVLIWHNKVTLLNVAGLIMILTALFLIALNSNKNKGPGGVTLKWLIAVAFSLILSGTFQTLNSFSSHFSPEALNTGMRIPILFSAAALGNGIVTLWESKMQKTEKKTVPRIFIILPLVWCVIAISSYFIMFHAIDAMHAVNADALTFPIVIGVNISTFSLYSKFKLHEPYSLKEICCLLLCALGIIFLTLK